MGVGQQILLASNAAGGASFGPGPNTLANLELWLDAYQITGLSDGAQISTWLDSSGNGRDATGVIGTAATKPLYRATSGPNSQPCCELAPTNSTTGPWFTLPNFLTGFSAGEGFAVIKINFDPPSTLVQRCGPPFGSFGSSATQGALYPFTDGIIYEGFGSTVRKTTNNPTTTLAQWNCYNVRSAAGAFSWALNAATSGNDFFSTGTNTVGWSTAPFIGHDAIGNSHVCGYIAEIILYSRVLNDTTERKAVVHAYLNTKYGFSLPT